MQSETEFDAYVDTYDESHRKSIKLSGEEPSFFAEYKIVALAKIAQKADIAVSKILDFGAGMGNSVPFFRRYFRDADLTLADVSRESLDRATQKYGEGENHLHLETGCIPSDPGVFDIVFSACVFHHIPQEEHHSWMEELRRVTKPGGRLVVFEHNPWNPLTRHAVANCSFDENAVLISAPEMVRRFKRAGWKEPAAKFHMFFPSSLASLRRFEPQLGWCPLGAQYACIGEAN